VKKLILFILLAQAGLTLQAQDDAGRPKTKQERKAEKRERINAIIKQEEEGNLAYLKQNGFGIQLRTNGYGIFFEIGRRRTQRFTTTYSIELSEIKHPKEVKSGGYSFLSPYIYGKANNFYQAKIGYGQQYILGQKGNKNGVAIIALAQGGLSMGLLKPYYINSRGIGGDIVTIKYSQEDSVRFLSYEPTNSSAGFFKGWSELQLRPGLYLKAALRFDFGRFNESVNAIEVGMSVEGYAKKIDIMAPVHDDRLGAGPQRIFYQGHIAFVFGRRK